MWQKRKLRASNKLSLDAGIVKSFASTAGLFFCYKSPRVSAYLCDSRQWAQGNRPASICLSYVCACLYTGRDYNLLQFTQNNVFFWGMARSVIPDAANARGCSAASANRIYEVGLSLCRGAGR